MADAHPSDANGDKRIARRLLACAALAMLVGAGSVLATPGAPTPFVQKGQATAAPTQGVGDRAGELRGKLERIGGEGGGQDTDGVEQVAPVTPVTPDEAFIARTPGGVEVRPMLPTIPLTVKERVRLRADVNDRADVLDAINPGEPLRVVGAVLLGADARRRESYWLQVRLQNGGVGYVRFTLAADLAGWRQAQVAARVRRQKEAAEAAAAASGIPIDPALPPEFLDGAPILSPAPEDGP